MPRRPPSLPVSLLLFVAGLLLVYYVFHANRGNGADLVTVWNHLAVVNRLIALAGFMASAYGLGGILNGLLMAARRR